MKDQDPQRAESAPAVRRGAAPAERRFDRPTPPPAWSSIPEIEGSAGSGGSGHSFAKIAARPPGRTALPPIQGRFGVEARDADRVLRPSGAGSPLPDPLRQRMESAFNADFSDVRTHEGPEAPSIGAVAFTRGSDIHFAPGEFSPSSSAGERLLAHELTHVVQQRAGRVPVPPGPGLPINDDPSLEREADRLGESALGRSPRAGDD